MIADSDADVVFQVPRIGGNAEKEFSQVDLAHIVEPRVTEIFQLIQAEVQRLGYKELPGGYVLTGGTVSMPGVEKVAQQIGRAACRERTEITEVEVTQWR